MHRTLSFLFTLIALGLGLAACEQNPTSSPHGSVTPMKPSPPSSTANPKVTYVTPNGGGVYVMDTTGQNQSQIYSTNGTCFSPHWSPSNSISFIDYTNSGNITTSLKTVDVSVSNGVPVGSNTRTLDSFTASPGSDSLAITFTAWSSTSSVGRIAYVVSNHLSGSRKHYVCSISAAGGTRDTLYVSQHNTRIGAIAWKSDDSRIAIRLISVGSTGTNAFVVINPATRAVTDSIYLGGSGNASAAYLWWETLDWSRGPALNKLVYYWGATSPDLYYLTPTTGSSQTKGGFTTHNTYGFDATWSPDNSYVMFLSQNLQNGSVSLKKKRYSSGQTDDFGAFDGRSLNWHR